MQLTSEPPRLGETDVVAKLLQQWDCVVRDRNDVREGFLGLRERPQEFALDHRTELELRVAGGVRGGERLVKDAFGAPEVARPHQGTPQNRQDLSPLLVRVG